MTALMGGDAGARPWRDRAVRLVESLTTPALPADYLDLFAPLRSGADLRGRVVAVESETADAATIVIKPGRDWAGHVPGQYLRLGVDIDGVRHWRAYSLTHGPRSDGLISITAKALADGLVSNHLVRELKPGTLVHLEQAAGEFVLPVERDRDHAPRKLLFVTAGSGITPVMGMLRNLSASGALDGADRRYDIVVVHLNVAETTSIFRSELLDAHQRESIALHEHFDERDGLFDVTDLPTLVRDLDERETLACGPAPLLDALAEFLAGRGLKLQTEQFRLTRIEPGEGGSVTFAKQDKHLDLDGATAILQAAEEAGVLMPSGCRMGICMACVLPMKQGAVRDLRNGSVTTVDQGAAPHEWTKVQTCINAAAGECHLDH